MGNSKSRRNTVKQNKNSNRQKMFRLGVSFGRNDLNLEGHIQMGYTSKTIKNYGPIEQPKSDAIVSHGDVVTSESETAVLENPP